MKGLLSSGFEAKSYKMYLPDRNQTIEIFYPAPKPTSKIRFLYFALVFAGTGTTGILLTILLHFLTH